MLVIFRTNGANNGALGFYLMGMWYKRDEAQKRFSFFFSSTSLAGAFGGVLASGIGKMHGMRNYLGWRWIFILEGTLTAVVSVACFFLIADFPEEVKWLNEEERNFIRAKLAKDSGSAGHNISLGWRDVLDVLKDCMAPNIDLFSIVTKKRSLTERFPQIRSFLAV